MINVAAPAQHHYAGANAWPARGHSGTRTHVNGSALNCIAICMQEPLQLRNTNTLAPKDGLRVRVLPRALEREA